MYVHWRKRWVNNNHSKYTGEDMYVATPLNKFASSGAQLDIDAVSRAEYHQCTTDCPLAIMC